MSKFLCCICEATLATGKHGQDVIVGPCAKCREKLRRELNMAMPNFKTFQYLLRRAA